MEKINKFIKENIDIVKFIKLHNLDFYTDTDEVPLTHDVLPIAYKEFFDPLEITECPRKIIYKVNDQTIWRCYICNEPATRVLARWSYDPSIATRKPICNKCPDNGADSTLGYSIEFLPYTNNTDLLGYNRKVQDKWDKILSSVKGFEILGHNIIASDYNFNLTGIAPLVVRISNVNFVVTIHVLNKIQHECKKKHVIENLTYTWLLDQKHGLIIYDSKDDFTVFETSLFAPIIKSIKNKCRYLLEHKLLGTIPDKPYKQKAQECSECIFLNKCWEKKRNG